MADEARVNIPHGRPASDEDHSACVLTQRLFRIHARAQDAERAIGTREFRHAGNCSGAGKENVSSRNVEEARNVRDVLRSGVSLPRQRAVKTELPRLTDRAYDPYDRLLHVISYSPNLFVRESFKSYCRCGKYCRISLQVFKQAALEPVTM
jgi:hypothetical protein